MINGRDIYEKICLRAAYKFRYWIIDEHAAREAEHFKKERKSSSCFFRAIRVDRVLRFTGFEVPRRKYKYRRLERTLKDVIIKIATILNWLRVTSRSVDYHELSFRIL